MGQKMACMEVQRSQPARRRELPGQPSHGVLDRGRWIDMAAIQRTKRQKFVGSGETLPEQLKKVGFAKPGTRRAKQDPAPWRINRSMQHLLELSACRGIDP